MLGLRYHRATPSALILIVTFNAHIFTNAILKKMKKIIPPAKNNIHDYPGKCQKVVAVWPNGKVAGFFDSIKVAVDKYGFSRDGITRCCRGRQKLCGGLNWFYEKDYMPIHFSGDASELVLPADNIRNPNGTFKKGHHNNKGKKRRMTPEYLQNRRENMLRQHRMGLLPHDNTRNFKAVIEIETGTTYPSIGHAAQATGYTRAGMQHLLKQPHKAKKTGYHYFLKSTWDEIQNHKSLSDA